MPNSEADFEKELEVFRTEAEAATQFFYTYLTVHAVAGDNAAVYRLLNTAPLFWNTNLGALQTSTFVVLGRIFDQGSAHNIDRLLKLAQDNSEMFSKSALGRRKQGTEQSPPVWLAAYLREAYVPKPSDFRRLRSHVNKHRRIYTTKYRDLRRKVFAHKELSDGAAITALFAKTNVRELQRMLMFLNSLYDALWQLFVNGRKPVLRARRYSVRRMRKKPSSRIRSGPLQERITHEVEQFLSTTAKSVQSTK